MILRNWLRRLWRQSKPPPPYDRPRDSKADIIREVRELLRTKVEDK